MHARIRLLSAAALALCCAGCASTPDQTSDPREERIYRTGSNIPTKDYGDVKVVDPASVQDMTRRGPIRNRGGM